MRDKSAACMLFIRRHFRYLFSPWHARCHFALCKRAAWAPARHASVFFTEDAPYAFSWFFTFFFATLIYAFMLMLRQRFSPCRFCCYYDDGRHYFDYDTHIRRSIIIIYRFYAFTLFDISSFTRLFFLSWLILSIVCRGATLIFERKEYAVLLPQARFFLIKSDTPPSSFHVTPASVTIKIDARLCWLISIISPRLCRAFHAISDTRVVARCYYGAADWRATAAADDFAAISPCRCRCWYHAASSFFFFSMTWYAMTLLRSFTPLLLLRHFDMLPPYRASRFFITELLHFISCHATRYVIVYYATPLLYMLLFRHAAAAAIFHNMPHWISSRLSRWFRVKLRCLLCGWLFDYAIIISSPHYDYHDDYFTFLHYATPMMMLPLRDATFSLLWRYIIFHVFSRKIRALLTLLREIILLPHFFSFFFVSPC